MIDLFSKILIAIPNSPPFLVVPSIFLLFVVLVFVPVFRLNVSPLEGRGLVLRVGCC